MTTIVPVVTTHVGWVSVARGVAGAVGTALITKFAEETQVGLAVLLTLIVYVAPAGKALNVAELCQVVPFLLYCKFVPRGDVTTIVPVFTAHVGCVSVASGVVGAVGIALIIKVANDTHVGLALFRTPIMYVTPAGKPLNVAELCQVVPFLLYCKLAPNGDVTTIVPVVTLHVG